MASMAATRTMSGLLRSLPKRARRLLRVAPRIEPGREATSFRCNICNAHCRVEIEAISRETPSCYYCGSTVRFRAIVHLLTKELFGRSIALSDLPRRKDLVGIGLSDSGPYARRLARHFDYTNTYYHRKPRLDITDVPAGRAAACDFMICSDVFEHVAPPVSRAFANARRLLKPGGVLIFTAPFTLAQDTVEHFPDLHDYRLLETARGWTLENRTADGRLQVYNDLVFHGGRGSTMEMRLFSRAGLEREFAAAGFVRVRVAAESCLEHGIIWHGACSVPMVAYA